MVREAWVKPMTLVQKFEANEAVTACLQIKCNSDTYCAGANVKYGDDHSPSDDFPKWNDDEYYSAKVWYDPHTDCKTYTNNPFSFDTGVAVFTGNGGIDSIIDANDDGVKGNEGDRVYWHTFHKWNLSTLRLNHWGTIEPSSNKS